LRIEEKIDLSAENPVSRRRKAVSEINTPANRITKHDMR